MKRPIGEQAIDDLSDEIMRARNKFPNNDRLFLALIEEVGELAKAILENGNVDEEALHVACVAMRIYTEGMLEYEAKP
jgi:NTP pyrophosphatase (non-canonical NTP hydrolase)